MHIHPLLPLLLPLTTATASPSPPILPATSPALSLVPYHTLFYRQLSDLQTFTAALGGVRASSITNSGIPDRPFEVGGDNFPDFESAAQRSCDRQFQGCQEMANSNGNGNGGGGDGDGGGKGKGKGFTVGMCGEQKCESITFLPALFLGRTCFLPAVMETRLGVCQGALFPSLLSWSTRG